MSGLQVFKNGCLENVNDIIGDAKVIYIFENESKMTTVIDTKENTYYLKDTVFVYKGETGYQVFYINKNEKQCVNVSENVVNNMMELESQNDRSCYYFNKLLLKY